MRPILLFCAALAASGAHAGEPIGRSFSIPVPNAEHGRMLFVQKGCVICHSVNGIGGAAGPALDASEPAGVFDPLDFAARMWRGAPMMLALQETELGYQIELSGADIADLAAFAEHHEEQSRFGEDQVPEVMQGWTIDQQDRMIFEPQEEN